MEQIKAAILKGNTDLLKQLLIKLEPSCCSDVLLFALRTRRLESIRVILEHHGVIDVNSSIKNDQTALDVAIQADQLEIAELLMSFGASTEKSDSSSSETTTRLMDAARKQNVEMVNLLLKHGADVNATVKNNRTSNLHLAVRSSTARIVEILLNHGADIDAMEQDMTTVLQAAVIRGCKEVFHLLLERGANVNLTGANGTTALHTAFTFKRDDFALSLIQHRANVNVKDCDGLTVLHLAARDNEQEAVKFLLQNGAKVDCPDVDGFTPLYFGLKYREMVELLLNNGANKNVTFPDGSRLVEYAFRRADLDTFKLLLMNCGGGTDEISLTNNDGTSLIQDAFHSQREDIVNYFLDSGISTEDIDRLNLLHLVFRLDEGKEAIVGRLLREGANVNRLDEHGFTALYYAIENGNLELIKVLVRNGAKVDVKMDNGTTALARAMMTENTEIIKYLKNKVQGPHGIAEMKLINSSVKGGSRRVGKLMANLKFAPY